METQGEAGKKKVTGSPGRSPLHLYKERRDEKLDETAKKD